MSTLDNRKNTNTKLSTSAKRKDLQGSVENATSKQIESIEKDLKELAKDFPDVDFQIKKKYGKATMAIAQGE